MSSDLRLELIPFLRNSPDKRDLPALAYNLLRNRDEARDCVQDVYAELGKTCYNVQLSRIT